MTEYTVYQYCDRMDMNGRNEHYRLFSTLEKAMAYAEDMYKLDLHWWQEQADKHQKWQTLSEWRSNDVGAQRRQYEFRTVHAGIWRFQLIRPVDVDGAEFSKEHKHILAGKVDKS